MKPRIVLFFALVALWGAGDVLVFQAFRPPARSPVPSSPASAPVYKPSAPQPPSRKISSPQMPSGPVTWLSVPSAGIATPVHPMPTSCKTEIVPPETGAWFREVYQCGDFTDPLVLAGHSSKYTATVLNALYERGLKLKDESITLTAGGKSYVYKITAVYTPAKSELPHMSQVWEPRPGKLVIVTCDQFSTSSGPASENFVVTAQEEGT